MIYAVFAAVIGIKLVNYGFLAVYCRVAEYVDRRSAMRAAGGRSGKNAAPDRPGDMKHILGAVYDGLNGYFYGWTRYCIVRTGKLPSHRIRNLLYRYVYNMKITGRTVIYGDCEIRSPWNIRADNCVISTGCILDGRKGISIGQNTVFGGHVHVWTEEHDLDDPWFGVTEHHARPVNIGDRCWICSDSTILPGVTVGDGAVIASRAVATGDCDCLGVYAGIPARKIGRRNSDLRYELSGKPCWHFW